MAGERIYHLPAKSFPPLERLGTRHVRLMSSSPPTSAPPFGSVLSLSGCIFQRSKASPDFFDNAPIRVVLSSADLDMRVACIPDRDFAFTYVRLMHISVLFVIERD